VPEQTRKAFAYAIVRVVPDIERGESFNAGVVLFCRQLRFLAARVGLDEDRLAALAPGLAAEVVTAQLEAIVSVAAGDPAAGPIAAMPESERFGWLVAPSSTIIQPSPVHTGLCENPAETLHELFAELVG
jgi:Protein of unknown function (DUF3037)